jgi:capsid protein
MRLNASRDGNDVVYRMWMMGEVQRGNIEAPGFMESYTVQSAWVNAKWVGNQRPDIDPLKSVNANVIEQNRGYKTGKQITSERGGGDYDENLVRCAMELEKVAEIQVPFAAVDVNLEDQ